MAEIRPDTQNRVQLRPVTDAKLEAQDFGQEKIGRGLAGFGQSLSQVAQDWDDINAIHDEAAVKKIDTEVLAATAEARRAVANAKGEQALTAGETYKTSIDNIRKDALSKLTNDRQKRMFTDVFERRAVVDYDVVQGHLDKETRTFAVDSGSARAKEMALRAVDNWDNVEEFDRSIVSVVNEVEAIGRLQGKDEQMRKVDKDEAVSGVYAGVVERIAVEDAIKARKFLDAHAGKITPDMETKLRVRLQPAWLEMRAEEVADAAIAGVVDLGLNSAVEDVTAAEGVKPDPAKTEENLKINQWPLRDYGKSRVKGGQFGAPRDGGTRAHGGLDYPAPLGTPVLPRLRGKVIEVDTVGKTDAGFYVKVKYADGHVGSYSHLRNINVNPGDDVDTDTVIGGVGGTGKGGKSAYGSHLHEVIRRPDGTAINPENYKPKGVLADPAQRGYGPKYDGNAVDIKAAYALIEKQYQQGDISLALRKEAMRAIDDRARREDSIKDRAFDAARDQAAEAMIGIIKNGGDLTDPVRQIPNFGDLHPDVQLRYLDQAETIKARQASAAAAAADAANKARIEGNYSAFLEISSMADTNPAKFMQLPIDSLRGSFPESDWKALKKRQEEYRRQGTYRPQLAPERSKVSGLVNTVLGDAKINPKKLADPASIDAKRKTYLVEEAMRQIDAYQQSGQKMTDAQINEQVLKPLLRKVIVQSPGFFGDSEEEMPWYQAQMEGYTSARIAD